MDAPAQRGLTLLELLLALLLGTVLLLALAQFVTQTRQFTARLESVDHRLDHQRLSWLLVQRDIQMAGFQSCLPQLPAAWDGPELPFARYPVLGWEALGTAPGDHWSGTQQPPWISSHGLALPSRLAGQVAPGADVLVLNRAVRIPLSDWLSVRTSAQQLSLRFSQSIGVRYGETVVLADLDCQQTVHLRQLSTRGDTLTVASDDIPEPLQRLLSVRAWDQLQLLSWQSQAYYVGFVDDHWSLFRRRLERTAAPSEELIRGVLTQQVLYGEPAASGDGLIFRAADQVQQWPQVRALHWGLLLTDSVEPSSVPEPQSVLGVQGWFEPSWPIERSFSLRQGH
jgi:type IV pilus assembly protein PilW